MMKTRVAWTLSAEIKARFPNTNSETTNVENLKNEPITSDLYQALYPIYHLSKICGLLPMRFSPLGRGLYSGKLSKIEISYGFMLILILISFQTWGLNRDLYYGWKNTTRLSSNISVTVTCSDVITVAGVVVAAILSFPFRWKYLQKSIDKLTKVDEKIGMTSIKKLQKKTIILITFSLAFLLVISICDFFTWLDSNKNKNLLERQDRDIFNYCPIYIMYFVITIFEIQYALATLNIGERFSRMNQIIKRFLNSYQISENFKKDLVLDNEFKHERQMASDLGNHPGRRMKVFDWLIAGNDSKTIADGLSLLISLHGNLCESTILLNSGFGIPLLFCTVSCLHHLIITPYFVYTELQDQYCNWKVIIKQIVWIFFHAMGLLFTVEPCYWSTLMARRTGIIISELMTCKWDSQIRKQLEIFSLQTLQRPLVFSTCGLFSMDRALLTSIAGAVTTYMVILIQFQSGDEGGRSIKNASDIIKTLTDNVLKKPQ